jgi:hypothetical protein
MNAKLRLFSYFYLFLSLELEKTESPLFSTSGNFKTAGITNITKLK